METGWWYYYTHSTNYTNIALKTSNADVILEYIATIWTLTYLYILQMKFVKQQPT